MNEEIAHGACFASDEETKWTPFVMIWRALIRKTVFVMRSNSRPGLVAHAYNPSTLGMLKRMDHLRSGVQPQPGQHGKTPSLLKIQKLAGHGGACL